MASPSRNTVSKIVGTVIKAAMVTRWSSKEKRLLCISTIMVKIDPGPAMMGTASG